MNPRDPEGSQAFHANSRLELLLGRICSLPDFPRFSALGDPGSPTRKKTAIEFFSFFRLMERHATSWGKCHEASAPAEWLPQSHDPYS